MPGTRFRRAFSLLPWTEGQPSDRPFIWRKGRNGKERLRLSRDALVRQVSLLRPEQVPFRGEGRTFRAQCSFSKPAYPVLTRGLNIRP